MKCDDNAAIVFSTQAFVTYDRDNSASVTRGEFRRVLESFCMVFSSDQFENIMNKVPVMGLYGYLGNL